jgi:FkbM family methyltransferase
MTPMKFRIYNFIFKHRAIPQRLISILVPKPVLLNLRDFKMYVRLDDWAVGLPIALKHKYEEHVTNVMRPCFKPGMVVVDIGANIGFYTLLAASRIGQAGKVIAFEPSADNCELLRRSLRKNDLNNVTIHTNAVSDANRVLCFTMQESTAVTSRPDTAKGSFQVNALALDSFLKDEPRIDLVKIDIDGGEGLALKGMTQLLKRHHPVLFTEFCPELLQAISGITPQAYLDGLRNLGYEFRILSKKTAGGATEGNPPQSNEQIMQRYTEAGLYHLDLLALPKERSAQLQPESV